MKDTLNTSWVSPELREYWNKKFHERFGNVYDYTMEHTDWWILKLEQERKSLVEKVEGLERECPILGASSHKDMLQEHENFGYNQAVSDILKIIKTK